MTLNYMTKSQSTLTDFFLLRWVGVPSDQGHIVQLGDVSQHERIPVISTVVRRNEDVIVM